LRKTTWLLIAVGVWLGASSVGTFAQSCKVQFVCSTSSFYSGCQPPLPPTYGNCVGNGPWSALCDVLTNQCSPPNAPDETCPTCNRGGPRAGGGGGSAGGASSGGSPISLATGNTNIEQTDIGVPGLGGGLRLSRVWNSRWPSSQNTSKVGMFGSSWRSTYEERVFVGSDGYMKYARADGSFWSFGYSTTDASSNFVYLAAAPANAATALTTGTTNWTLTFKDGEVRLFDNTTGLLTSIVDRNGNTTQLTYDASNRLVTVTDPASRHLSFTYSGSSPLVQTVTADVGISLSYTYDAQQRLTRVTEPDTTFMTFEYDANSLITAVKDSQGKILESHTYDSLGRGLTSSRANGVDAVTVSYPQ
jgi:YD repeat-containing protein